MTNPEVKKNKIKQNCGTKHPTETNVFSHLYKYTNVYLYE